ncbi:MAG: hypothetical protein P4L41_00320 [Flavipsychrobacter sp.]|nr:hypothetical protein [Flavipsychrobacter sp.]
MNLTDAAIKLMELMRETGPIDSKQLSKIYQDTYQLPYTDFNKAYDELFNNNLIVTNFFANYVNKNHVIRLSDSGNEVYSDIFKIKTVRLSVS